MMGYLCMKTKVSWRERLIRDPQVLAPIRFPRGVTTGKEAIQVVVVACIGTVYATVTKCCCSCCCCLDKGVGLLGTIQLGAGGFKAHAMVC